MARAWIAASLLLLSACADAPAKATERPAAAPATAQPDNYAAFGRLLAEQQRMSERVARISRRLRVANAPLCADTRLDVGVTAHSLRDYPEAIRPLALHYLSLDERGEFVRAVVPGSPADRAGVRKGDRIVSGFPASPSRPLVLDSGDAMFRVENSDTACRAPVRVINSDVPNAGTDGRTITVTRALVAQAGDDDALAFIIAHEMAHMLARHTEPGWAAELEADRGALVLLHNAGFGAGAVVAGWSAGMDAHRFEQSVSATHPPVEIRFKALQEALARLEASERATPLALDALGAD